MTPEHFGEGRLRAVGGLKLLNVPVPPFDPRDEHLD